MTPELIRAIPPGTYNIPALPSGTYKVEAAQAGFNTVRSTVVVFPMIASRAGTTVTPQSFLSERSRRIAAATSCSSRSAAATAMPSRTRATQPNVWPLMFWRSAAVIGIGTHTCCCSDGNMNALGMTPITVYRRSSSVIWRPRIGAPPYREAQSEWLIRATSS